MNHSFCVEDDSRLFDKLQSLNRRFKALRLELKHPFLVQLLVVLALCLSFLGNLIPLVNQLLSLYFEISELLHHGSPDLHRLGDLLLALTLQPVTPALSQGFNRFGEDLPNQILQF